MVPKTFVNPDGAHGETVAVANVDAEEEEAHRQASQLALLHANLSDSLEEEVVVFDFKLFLAEGDDNSNSTKSLLSISSRLSICSNRSFLISLHD